MDYTLYICCSHLYVPAVLSLISESNSPFLLYTDKADLTQCFSYLGFADSVFFDNYSSNYYNFIAEIKRKFKIKSWIAKYNIQKVYFFHEAYCEIPNWLMLFLDKRNNIDFYYVPIAKSYDVIDTCNVCSFRSMINRIYCNLLWNYSPVYIDRFAHCGLMPLSFYCKLNVKKYINYTPSRNDLCQLVNRSFHQNAIVLLSNPNISDLDSQKKYIEFLDQAIRPILSSLPIYFKNHPGKKNKLGIEKNLEEIPSFISGNLLTHSFKFFIGVNSALLCEAANDGAIAICLANLVGLKDDRNRIINYHLKLSERVLFPNTIEELWQMLKQ